MGENGPKIAIELEHFYKALDELLKDTSSVVADRSTPEETDSIKIVLGVLKEKFKEIKSLLSKEKADDVEQRLEQAEMMLIDIKERNKA